MNFFVHKLNLKKWYFWLSLALINIGLIIFFKSNPDGIKQGDISEFWDYACDIQTSKFTGHMVYNYGGGIYPRVGENYHYFTQMHHQQHIFYITEEQLNKDFQEVSTLIKQDVPALKERIGQWEKLKKNLSKTDSRAVYKLRDIDQERHEEFVERRNICKRMLLKAGDNPKSFTSEVIAELSKKKSFWGNPKHLESLIKSSSSRWRALLFEFLFLNGLTIFFFWPGLAQGTPRSWGKHVSLSVIILFLPYFFGYSELFTFGPTGAIVYPLIAMLVGFPLYVTNLVTPLDKFVLPLLPNILGQLSPYQESWAAKGYYGGIGIVELLLYSLVVGAIAYGVSKYRLRKRKIDS